MEPAAPANRDDIARLDRLEGYLRQDPGNAQLLADTFDAALRAGERERAEFHLRHAQALGLDRHGWLLREAHWHLAQHQWTAARLSLQALRDEVPKHAALATTIVADLAYLDLRERRYGEGIALLEAMLDPAPATLPPADSMQMLWLRLLHRAQELERAIAWLHRQEASAVLSPNVAGVGSLVALDVGDYAASLRWATAALEVSGPVIEAIVTRASLALGERNGALARQLLAPAVTRHPDDGRVWSAWGFAQLLEEDWGAARQAFERAARLLPDHIGTWHGLGWAALSQSDLRAARRAFETALALDRNFAENHGALAVVDTLLGEVEGARSAIKVALRLDPTSLSARYAQALIAGEVRDGATLHRLAERLLSGRRGPMGNNIVGLLRGKMTPRP